MKADKADVRRLERRMEARFGEMDARFGEMMRQFEGLRQQLNGVAKEIWDRLDKHERLVNEYQGRFKPNLVGRARTWLKRSEKYSLMPFPEGCAAMERDLVALLHRNPRLHAADQVHLA